MLELAVFEENINYKFKNIKLLNNALTHTSYAYENKVASNEKLEFLGDAILEFVTSDYLYRNYKKLREGEMTKVRAAVVCENSLYEVAKQLGFSDFLKVGRSERINHGNEKPAIMADAVEALIAAIYLDSGIDAVKNFIIDNLCNSIKIASANVGMKDYKTVLQEKLQSNKGEVHIEYEIIEEKGPDHNKIFTAQVKFNGKILASGEGKSKKEAEMEAARFAIEENKI